MVLQLGKLWKASITVVSQHSFQAVRKRYDDYAENSEDEWNGQHRRWPRHEQSRRRFPPLCLACEGRHSPLLQSTYLSLSYSIQSTTAAKLEVGRSLSLAAEGGVLDRLCCFPPEYLSELFTPRSSFSISGGMRSADFDLRTDFLV